MTTKIRIKAGNVEIEYEGSEDFLEKQLREIVSTVLTLQNEVASNQPETAECQELPSSPKERNGGTANLSVSTIATKLNAQTGPELLIAAAAALTFSENKEDFSRNELHEEMKKAKAFYKKNYSSNLSKIILGKIKSGAINEGRSGKYSLSSESSKNLRIQLEL